MKYLKGDEVKVKYNINCHGFDIGDKLEILDQDEDEGGVVYRAVRDDGLTQWIWQNELE